MLYRVVPTDLGARERRRFAWFGRPLPRPTRWRRFENHNVGKLREHTKFFAVSVSVKGPVHVSSGTRDGRWNPPGKSGGKEVWGM